MAEYESFSKVRDELEAAGKTFDAASLRRIRYGDLFLATIGNAGRAICRDDGLMRAEGKRRLDEAFQLAGVTTVDQVAMVKFEDHHMKYDAFRRFVPKSVDWNALDVGVRLYLVCTCIRGHWGDAKERVNLVIALCDDALKREALPAGWAARCRYLATDVFDGNFADGRVFRDGSMVLPPDVAKQLGIPEGQVVSGNLMRLAGARPDTDAKWDGSYEQLFEKILTPAQKAQALCRKVENLPYDDECSCYAGEE